jgi:hypothetical protein
VAFLDEDELQPSGPRASGAERQRQLLVRRVIALGVGVLIIILLLLGVRGCLNARKERGFESYTTDLSEIAKQSNQLAAEFFRRFLEPPANADELQLEAEISSDRGTAESLLQRVEGLDAPDEVAEAQDEVVQAFELRRDALAGIADDIPVALGDVIYARAQHDIQTVLDDEGISGKVPDSIFLSEPVDRWLDRLSLYTILSNFAGASGATEGVHGLALLSTTIDKTVLTADAENTVPLGNDPPNITVEIQNQGDQEEKEVTVHFSLTGGAVPVEGEVAITNLDSQGIDEAKVTLDDTPDVDTPLTLEVEVLPVPGEESSDNNAATYTVTFD